LFDCWRYWEEERYGSWIVEMEEGEERLSKSIEVKK